MIWIQENLPLIIAATIVLWMVLGRVIRPKILGIKKMSAATYADFKQAHTLIDVRSKSEWNSGHAAGAQHIPLNEFKEHIHRIPKDKAVILICASGMRSAMAANVIAKAGHRDVYNFAGGFNSWSAAGLPKK